MLWGRKNNESFNGVQPIVWINLVILAACHDEAINHKVNCITSEDLIDSLNSSRRW
jgi:hypothetical protein